MFILVDLKRMCVVHRHEEPKVLRSLAQIEVAHTAICIFDETRPANYARFSDLELKMLYESMSGEKWPPHAQHRIATLIALAQYIPETDADGFEAYLQAASIPDNDVNYYRYVKGANKPEQVRDLFITQPRLAVPKAAQVVPPAPSAPVPPRPVAAPAQAPTVPPAPTKPAPKIPPPWA